jgi:hypothetical protein
MNLTPDQIQQLNQKGITKEKVAQQIDTFTKGIPFVNLKAAATVGEGILRFTENEEQELVGFFETEAQNKALLKFVPASGAASRMFKACFNFLEAFDPEQESLEAYLDRSGDTAMKAFFDGLERFPFYDSIQDKLASKNLNQDQNAQAFVAEMLLENGLDFGQLPKGLLPFHKYTTESVTPFEEHLKEAVHYSASKGKASIHFTISPQHQNGFETEERIASKKIGEQTNTKFQVGYSFQKPSTDTLAVNMDNSPFLNPDGSLLFRPGGHGALIENLNEQDADIVFIKNIDNVMVDGKSDAMARSKKILAGHLLQVQQKAFGFAAQLEKGKSDNLETIIRFITEELNVCLPDGFKVWGKTQQTTFLIEMLNRPIRVCGMVKNEGEPGGGPFWIEKENGQVSLQIIESAQIDGSNADQHAILQNATHFNPVDLVCGIRNHKGEKYDLMQFVDHEQGFITEKTKAGKSLKALELPGLWNGAMAFWNTIFVEVPLLTFNPVKTVNDLLKPAHQAD